MFDFCVVCSFSSRLPSQRQPRSRNHRPQQRLDLPFSTDWGFGRESILDPCLPFAWAWIHILQNAKVTSNKMVLFSGKVFHTGSHGVLRFVAILSFKNHWIKASDWLSRNFNRSEGGFLLNGIERLWVSSIVVVNFYHVKRMGVRNQNKHSRRDHELLKKSG